MQALKQASYPEGTAHSPAASPESAPFSLSLPRFQTRSRDDFRNNQALAITSRCETRSPDAAAATLPSDARSTPDMPMWSERELLVRLGQMPVNLAAPLLRSTISALDTPTLLALIATTGAAHHRLIAARTNLDTPVIKALIKSGHDSVLLALAENPAAHFDAADKTSLMHLAQARDDLREALGLHPDFAPSAAPSLSEDKADALSAPVGHDNLKWLKLVRARYIDKAVIEAARRLDMEPTALGRALNDESPVTLALTARALDLDRAVFVDLVPYWQSGRSGQPRLKATFRALVLSIFSLTREAARQKLCAIIAAG